MVIFLEKKFHVQGHRGARGLMPENTIESCTTAIRLGVGGLEIDVVCSADGQIVVSHDPWMSPVFCSYPNGAPVLNANTEFTSPIGMGVNLYRMSYYLIRQFDCGSRENARFPLQMLRKSHKPTLIELIEAVDQFCKEHNLPKPFFNIEVKSHPKWYGKYVPMPTEFIKLLRHPLSILPFDTYYISSFDPRFLRAFKKENPKVTLAYLTENRLSLKDNLRKLSFKPDIYSPYYRRLNDKTIRLCKKMGIQIITWTVNDLNVMRKLKQRGISGIITDFPDII